MTELAIGMALCSLLIAAAGAEGETADGAPANDSAPISSEPAVGGDEA